MSFRIIVTGSRDWDDPETVLDALDSYLVHDDVVLLHGGAESGVDPVVDRYARQLGWEVKPYPANWDLFRGLAGQMRNLEMVVDGADACLAFVKDHSRDASLCAYYARMSHIPTRVWAQDGEHDWSYLLCQEYLEFGDIYFYCTKEAADKHTEHEGKGEDDEGKAYFISWKD